MVGLNSLPWPPVELALAVSLGLIVLMIIRGRQVWTDRRYYGYSVYQADRLRRWLHRRAEVALVLVLAGAGAYWWFASSAGITPRQVVSAARQVGKDVSVQVIIPRLGVDTSLVEVPVVGWEWDVSQISTQVGHLQGTPLPGEKGNAVIAGHVTDLGGVPGPFWELSKLQPGDFVYVVKGNVTLKYQVTEIRRVEPNDVASIYRASPGSVISLLTCDQFDGQRYAKRLIVEAQRVQG